MKLLPFERRYRLESVVCETCSGSGQYSVEHVCLNCRGLGRRVTARGRELFYAIAEHLLNPVHERESRISPKHLDTIRGGRLWPEMRVRPIARSRMADILGNEWRDVARVFSRGDDDVEVTFADGLTTRIPDYEPLVRELTEKELADVDTLMAQHVGNGAEDTSG